MLTSSDEANELLGEQHLRGLGGYDAFELVVDDQHGHLVVGDLFRGVISELTTLLQNKLKTEATYLITYIKFQRTSISSAMCPVVPSECKDCDGNIHSLCLS